jgi:Ni/Co efflux regulator RcnB
MRRLLLLLAAILVADVATPLAAYAQMGSDDQQQQQDDAAAKKRKQDKEWDAGQAPLQQLKNAGPCPFVKVLYDAARYQEFKEGREASSAVGYTAEIQGVAAGCAYKSDEPIKVQMEILFEFGKGPVAEGSSKTYRYWVAVTHRNESVIAKQYFDLPVKFPEGQDRVMLTDKVAQILIPRATATTSGSNFEVLVGLDVTPEMAAFNRDGKRFRVNAGGAVAASGSGAAKP